MKIKQDPITGLYCREDGAVLMPPTGRKFKMFRWTLGSMHPDGYRVAQFQGKFYRVHILICRVFNGLAPEGKPFVDHINRIRDDNRPSNLRWVSHSENCNNKDYVDQALEKYGVHSCEDRKAYDKAYREAHREEYNVHQKAYEAKKRAQGLTMRKGPDGWGWYPFKRS